MGRRQLVTGILSIFLSGSAIVIALSGQSWGWLLAAAMLFVGTYALLLALQTKRARGRRSSHRQQ